jgi:hypothetical protein
MNERQVSDTAMTMLNDLEWAIAAGLLYCPRLAIAAW